MTSTRTSPEWRDDMPRTFSSIELPPHVANLQPRRRRLTAALLIPRLVSVSARR
jgi:hypothetical protein